ncbi:thiol oxidoreductase [Alginatibacterium sediminis]|uniref:Thiol oxidoreductase n=2 Tax=Alginatibacterium sediminis TaxID=2164068 RepID=A0A420E5N3_9ALTE|nr:thiol oxidoreductase [Alginatibacterium sediminis]
MVLCAISVTAIAQPQLAGGATTTVQQDHNAFSQPASNLDFSGRLEFSTGNSFFRNPWVAAPATTIARDGLGPLFNTNSCQSCHIKDGRGRAAAVGSSNAVSMLVRVSVPATNAEQEQQQLKLGPLPEPNYGGQIQDQSLSGHHSEARVRIEYGTKSVDLNGSAPAKLRVPKLVVDQLGYQDMHPETLFSVRVAPPMIGLGLLESIAEEDILKNTDPLDNNKDGISGQANWVWDAKTQQHSLGRFGWKAGQPNLNQQNAAAFSGDLGLTTSMFGSDDCRTSQTNCISAVNGGTPEVSDKILAMVEFYTQHLAVPMRRDVDSQSVMQGEKLFTQANCVACHQPSFVTQKREDRPALSEQVIYPYTDLLLHDMGDDLSDNRPEFAASGNQWRTPPLWGIGLTQSVNGHSELLHDGRARNVEEAILWHGGEAAPSQQFFRELEPKQRQQLVDFVNSL